MDYISFRLRSFRRKHFETVERSSLPYLVERWVPIHKENFDISEMKRYSKIIIAFKVMHFIFLYYFVTDIVVVLLVGKGMILRIKLFLTAILKYGGYSRTTPRTKAWPGRQGIMSHHIRRTSLHSECFSMLPHFYKLRTNRSML